MPLSLQELPITDDGCASTEARAIDGEMQDVLDLVPDLQVISHPE